MIGVVAKLKVNEGQGEAFEAAARDMVAAVARAEAGRTLAYTLARSQSDPQTYAFLELYADADALAAHGKTEHMAAFGGKLRGVLAGRAEIERFDVLTTLETAG